MAHLTWSDAYWYAYGLPGTGPGDDTTLVIHGRVGGFRDRAGELRACGSSGDTEALRQFVEARLAFCGKPMPTAQEWSHLRQSVDDFLRTVYCAGLVPVPTDVARRYRVYLRLIERWMLRTKAPASSAEPVDPAELKHLQNLRRWWDYAKRAWIDYPPPPVPRDILDLEMQRLVRAVVGTEVPPEQDAAGRAQIDAARRWPLRDVGRGRR